MLRLGSVKELLTMIENIMQLYMVYKVAKPIAVLSPAVPTPSTGPKIWRSIQLHTLETVNTLVRCAAPRLQGETI